MLDPESQGTVMVAVHWKAPEVSRRVTGTRVGDSESCSTHRVILISGRLPVYDFGIASAASAGELCAASPSGRTVPTSRP